MENVRIIQDLYQFFAQKDEMNIRKLFSEDIEWVQMEGFPGGGTNIGADAIFENVFNKFKDDWSDWKANTLDYQTAGDLVIVLGNYEGTYESTNKSMKAEFAHLYTIKNGKISKFVQYTDTFLIAQAMSS